ncbi:MAG: hypothetical protein KDA57_23130 [Planctomycetales bacterium]|nr:hypothetical protein [Planctomycetales bacterium]
MRDRQPGVQYRRTAQAIGNLPVVSRIEPVELALALNRAGRKPGQDHSANGGVVVIEVFPVHRKSIFHM